MVLIHNFRISTQGMPSIKTASHSIFNNFGTNRVVETLLISNMLDWFVSLIEKRFPILDIDEFIKAFWYCFIYMNNVRMNINKFRRLQQGDHSTSYYAIDFLLLACVVDLEALMDQFWQGPRLCQRPTSHISWRSQISYWGN